MNSTLRSLVASALVAGLFAASGATCFARDLTPAEHACCAMMAHDCGAADMNMSCCRVEAPVQGQAPAASTGHGIAVPTLITGPLALASEPHLSLQLAAASSFQLAVLALRERPVHLLLSVFLI